MITHQGVTIVIGKTYERRIIIDEPSNKDLFLGKGHERTAMALADAITSFKDTDRAIGLDGPWGSGKSSIVEIAEQQLECGAGKGKTSFHFFTFDIWKSQGSSFRRTFLEHFIFWATEKFPKKKDDLDLIEKKIKGKTREIDTDNHTQLDWYGILILISLPFLPIFYFWAKLKFDEKNTNFTDSWPFYILILFILITIAWSVFKWMSHNLNLPDNKKISLTTAISKTLLISSKQFEKKTVTQFIREIDPNDFEFQETLRAILSVIQDKNNKAVIVMDNIDRLPSDEIDDYWSFVRSVFSKNSLSQTKPNVAAITAIVPYDRSHIPVTISDESFESGINNEYLAIKTKRELFSKTFDEILSVAPPIMSNSRAFFEQKIEYALLNFDNKDELFRVYLIFNTLLASKNGHFTPRQIISFINELTYLFTIHQGLFPLSTVAVYISYRDTIESNPFVLTAPDFLNPKLRKLAPDRDIEKNLAAILYNVDAELALELLLDSRIVIASTKSDSSELVALSKYKGFDLRVDDVLQKHSQEWVSSDEFGLVIQNFVFMLQNYEGSAKSQIADSLFEGFSDTEEIKLSSNDYSPFFNLFEVCEKSKFPTITSSLTSKVLNGIENLDHASGFDWLNFLSDLQNYLNQKNIKGIFEDALSQITLPNDANFMLGAARNSYLKDIPLTLYKKVALKLPEDQNILEKYAEDDYDFSEHAFISLNQAKIIPQDRWVKVGNSIIENLKKPNLKDLEICQGYLETLTTIWSFLNFSKKSEIDLKTLFQSSQFYQNLHLCFGGEQSSIEFADTIFLARQTFLEGDLPKTAEHKNGSLTEEARVGYDWFLAFYDGNEVLTEKLLEKIASRAIESRKVTSWIHSGKVSNNSLINDVVRTALSFDELPRITLDTLLKNLEYLQSILGDEMTTMFRKFDTRIDENDLQKLVLANCPIGILHPTNKTEYCGWQKFHKKITNLLETVPADQWETKLTNGDHDVFLVSEKVKTSGIEIKVKEFKESFLKFVLDILSNKITKVDNKIDYDLVFNAIRQSDHSEIFRQTREKLTDVGTTGLDLGIKIFPNFLRDSISVGDRIIAKEKDNTVRHLLCTSLEANNIQMLNNFLALGRTKVNDYIKSSNDSTKGKLKGSLEDFGDFENEQSFTEEIVELIQGKRKSKSILNMWFPLLSNSSETNDED